LADELKITIFRDNGMSSEEEKNISFNLAVFGSI
jgi:hypothetical protein